MENTTQECRSAHCECPPNQCGSGRADKRADEAEKKLELIDDFRGGDAKLISCIKALISLSDEGALVPHGIGGHARGLLSAAAVRLAYPAYDYLTIKETLTEAMAAYLRTCSVGDMPKKLEDDIKKHLASMLDLNYLALMLVEKKPAAKSEHQIIAEFLERSGQYLTNDASREAAIADAVAAVNPVELIGAEIVKCQSSEAQPRDLDVLLDALNCTLKEHGLTLVDLSDEEEDDGPKGEVVLTKTQAGELVAVTRQDEDGQILSVLWEKPNQIAEPVAEWQSRYMGDPRQPGFWHNCRSDSREWAEKQYREIGSASNEHGWQVRPLFAIPPDGVRDAFLAGLSWMRANEDAGLRDCNEAADAWAARIGAQSNSDTVAMPRKLTPAMTEVLSGMLTNCHTVEESYRDLIVAATAPAQAAS